MLSSLLTPQVYSPPTLKLCPLITHFELNVTEYCTDWYTYSTVWATNCSMAMSQILSLGVELGLATQDYLLTINPSVMEHYNTAVVCLLVTPHILICSKIMAVEWARTVLAYSCWNIPLKNTFYPCCSSRFSTILLMGCLNGISPLTQICKIPMYCSNSASQK